MRAPEASRTLFGFSMEGWKRTYWAVYVANLVTAVGMMSFLPFFPTLVEELGASGRDEIAFWSGLCFGAAPLAAAFMGPFWGSFGDRFGRKAMVLRALVAITVFVGAITFVTSPWQLFLLRLCQGVFSGFVAPSVTLVSIAAPRERQGRVTGSLQTALAAGSILGPLLGALVHEALGIRSIFLVVAGLSAFAALLVGLVAREARGFESALGDSWTAGEVVGGALRDLRVTFASRRIRSALFVLFVLQFGIGATNPLLELYVRDVWRGAPEHVPRMTSILFTTFAAASVVAMPLWGRHGDRIGHGRALVRSALAGGIALALHAAAPLYGLLVGARLLLGLTSSGANSTSYAVAATESAAERRGSAMGAAFSARALAMSLGAMAGGGLAAVVGIRGLFLFGSACVLASLVLFRPARAVPGEDSRFTDSRRDAAKP